MKVLTTPRKKHARRADKKDPFTKPSFWADSNNWFWNTGRYTEKAKAYFMKNVVAPAQKEIDRRKKSDSVIWNLPQ